MSKALDFEDIQNFKEQRKREEWNLLRDTLYRAGGVFETLAKKQGTPITDEKLKILGNLGTFWLNFLHAQGVQDGLLLGYINTSDFVVEAYEDEIDKGVVRWRVKFPVGTFKNRGGS